MEWLNVMYFVATFLGGSLLMCVSLLGLGKAKENGAEEFYVEDLVEDLAEKSLNLNENSINILNGRKFSLLNELNKLNK